jgi:hypothetical protein
MLTEIEDQYIVIIDNDETYTENSTDNKSTYLHIYKTNEDEKPVSKHSIKVNNRYNETISSAILIGTAGATTIHDRSYCISEDRLFICVCNHVFCLRLPDLLLLWKLEVDFATAFGIFKMKEDYIIHGEIEISRINKNGLTIWQHSGSDIFILPNGNESFYIEGNIINVESWDGRKYKINYNGEIV